jgi:cellulose synthase/poly-beta-1,6-N-acetylglucosamine synthase-like glycosyltransferase
MGRFKKDTGGEDMELVVRLTYQALQDKKPYRVKYVHYASCYTELPADLKSLLKQRNRWQRGLLDILSYHRRILLNPRYKQPAMIGFPYFFVFEMMGPFIETIGYLALLVGLILGILNVPLVILLFTVTVAFGLVISLFSLFIAERKNTFYSIKEMFILILFCCLENFGFRQLMSVHRIKGTFASLKETGSWGAQNRQGFQKTTTK